MGEGAEDKGLTSETQSDSYTNVQFTINQKESITMFKVLKGIPLPKTTRGDLPPRKSKYPYAFLEIGDMFFIPNKEKNTLSTHTSTIGKKLDRKFSTRLTYMKFVNEAGEPVALDSDTGYWIASKEGEEGAVLGIGVWRVEPHAAVEAEADAAPASEQETPADDEDASAALLTPAAAAEAPKPVRKPARKAAA